MRVGVAREIKPQEYRVALTPAGARELVQKGHEVVVETNAGAGSQFPDADYEAAGARIAGVDEVWESAELLLKVKEPIAAEYPRLREGLTLFLAEELEEGEQDTDPGEDVAVVRLTRDELEDALARVEDMKTLAGLLLYLRG